MSYDTYDIKCCMLHITEIYEISQSSQSWCLKNLLSSVITPFIWFWITNLEKDFLYKFIGFKYRFRIYASWRQLNTEMLLCVWLGLIWDGMKKGIESKLSTANF